MAKKKKRQKTHPIDNIAKYPQQPRSPAPKRRTDFSLFLFSPSSSTLSSYLMGSSCGKDGLSNITITSLDNRKDKRKEMHEVPLVQFSKSQVEGQRLFPNFFQVPVEEVEPVSHDELSDPSLDRDIGEQKGHNVKILEFTPDKSQITESTCITPGSVVWAKTASQIWWPAEIMGERSTLAGSRNHDIDGCVLVQFYGNHHSAWVDPARDLSELENCFEERSCNPTADFQEALKQALYRKEHLSSCRQLFTSPDGPSYSGQPEQSSDKGSSSFSSRSESKFIERGRGKRERKPRVHFDEVTYPLKSVTKVRRFRIMRYLGLTAPIGSPFLTRVKNCFQAM